MIRVIISASKNLPNLLWIPLSTSHTTKNIRKYTIQLTYGISSIIENPPETSKKAVKNPSNTAIVFSGFPSSLNPYLAPIKYTDTNNNEKKTKSMRLAYASYWFESRKLFIFSKASDILSVSASAYDNVGNNIKNIPYTISLFAIIFNPILIHLHAVFYYV